MGRLLITPESERGRSLSNRHLPLKKKFVKNYAQEKEVNKESLRNKIVKHGL